LGDFEIDQAKEFIKDELQLREYLRLMLVRDTCQAIMTRALEPEEDTVCGVGDMLDSKELATALAELIPECFNPHNIVKITESLAEDDSMNLSLEWNFEHDIARNPTWEWVDELINKRIMKEIKESLKRD